MGSNSMYLLILISVIVITLLIIWNSQTASTYIIGAGGIAAMGLLSATILNDSVNVGKMDKMDKIDILDGSEKEIIGGYPNGIRIASLNVMNKGSTRFSIPKNGKELGEGESINDAIERYKILSEKIKTALYTNNIDILCLQEVPTAEYDIYEKYFAPFTSDYILVGTAKKPNFMYIKKSILMPNVKPSEFFEIIPEGKFQIVSLVLSDNSFINVVNIHLAGNSEDPDHVEKTKKFLLNYIEKVKIAFSDYYTIIVGDFNIDYANLNKQPFKKGLNTLHTIMGESSDIGNKKTSYHRFIWDNNNNTVYTKPSEKSWTHVDNIIFNYGFILKNVITIPEVFKGIETPYKPIKIENTDNFKFEKNFDTWPSDHAMVIYDLEYYMKKSSKN